MVSDVDHVSESLHLHQPMWTHSVLTWLVNIRLGRTVKGPAAVLLNLWIHLSLSLQAWVQPVWSGFKSRFSCGGVWMSKTSCSHQKASTSVIRFLFSWCFMGKKDCILGIVSNWHFLLFVEINSTMTPLPRSSRSFIFGGRVWSSRFSQNIWRLMLQIPGLLLLKRKGITFDGVLFRITFCLCFDLSVFGVLHPCRVIWWYNFLY